jgi:hypothetical protein
MCSEHQQRLENAKRSIELKRTDIHELNTSLSKYRNELRELEVCDVVATYDFRRHRIV